MTIAHSDATAGVYKIVGPDGKVSFSDKPPADAATTDKIDVIRTQTAPLSSTANPTTAPDTKASQKSHGKQAVAAPSQSNDVTANNPDAAIEKAIIGVLGYEDLVKQTADLCIRTLPTSSQRYSGAADSWHSRNAALVAQAHQALTSQFSSSQRQAIESGIRVKNNTSLSPVEAAPTASKISWCDSSTNEIKNGKMDVFNKPNLSSPLVKF